MLASWQVGEVIWTMFWFTIFFLWIWLVVMVFVDIFRSEDLGGWGKALWCIFIIFLPYLGVFVYLIARGHKMSARATAAAVAQQQAQQDYIRQVAGSASPADEIARLADLKAQGAISDAEFEQMKAKVLAS